MDEDPAPLIRILPDPAHLADAVAEAFVELLRDPAPAGAPLPAYEVGLTGGTVARAIHRAIARRADQVDWGYVRMWWGDERFLPREHPERNATQAREDFLDSLTLLPGEWPRPLLEDAIMEIPSLDEVDSVHRAAEVYADLVRHVGTGGFDLLMLGVGPDGHVASLFPGHPALEVNDEITVAVTDSPKPPPERVSLTFAAMERTAHVWFVVSGAEKAEAVRRSLAPTGTVTESPARGVRGHRQTVWWLDEAAATLLT
ncbi:MAG: 6-phosphogluconolactonase [Nocardioides sp.]